MTELMDMGGGGAGYVQAEALYQAARALGLDRPNIHYVISAKRDCHAESDLIAYQEKGEPFCRNLSMASDAPYGRISWHLGGALRMLDGFIDGHTHHDARIRTNPGLFDQAAKKNYLGGNMLRLACQGYRGIAAKLASDRIDQAPVRVLG